MRPTPQFAAAAAYIYKTWISRPGQVISFSFTPSTLELIQAKAPSSKPVPMTTAHGDEIKLLEMLAGFEAWSGTLTVSGHFNDQLCEFWITA